ncbi:Ca2+-binding RTX toxin-like protein [Rhodobacter viridis]|uniref:Ca2+-binding RTX toxin-like protein n=1 Tax=Rhodobacter viridis TaxID=1054202 RepID=A0A318U5H8_9RHOB|nr:calcium-binding protein [Rhodobacter viridis]PYF07169.1 Ca2+-binding RTX toxin-like protein [Rhodobacter viridis]
MSGYYAFDTLVYSISVTAPAGTSSAICTGVASLLTGDEVTGFTAQDDVLDLADFAGVTATIPLPDGTELSLAASELTPRLVSILWDDKVALVLSFQRQVIDGLTTTVDTALIVVAGAPLPAFATPDELMNFMRTNPPLPASMIFPEVTALSYADFDLSLASAAGDTLLGTALGETLAGLAGDDLIQALAGDDALLGGAGNDTLEGGGGADTLQGGAGDDVLRGGLGPEGDQIDGGDGIDTLDYTDLTLGYFRNGLVVDLGAGTANDGWFYIGSDTISGIENVNGTGGSDLLIGDAGANRLDGREGRDSLSGGDGADTLIGGISNAANPQDMDTLDGGAGNDSLAGGVGGDLLLGGADDDTIQGDAGNDGLDGGDGRDLLSGGTGNDFLSAGADDDTLNGDAGIDTLYGGTGDDLLSGGAGADSLTGDAGNDTYIVDATDTVSETNIHGLDMGGTDTVRAGVDYSLAAIDFVEVLVLTGTAAINGTGNAIANRITGTSGANVLDGAAGNDTLSGGFGNDTLIGGSGYDSLIGGGGNDLFMVDSGYDTVLELAAGGLDTISSSDNYALTMGGATEVETLILTGTADLAGFGNALSNLILGNDGRNTLHGDLGDDTIDGGLGDDVVEGDTGNDSLLGGLGNDTLAGGSGDDTLDGGAGGDLMIGAAGNDLYIVDDATDQVTEILGPMSGIDPGGIDTVRASVSTTLNADGTQYVEALVLVGRAAINGTGNALANTITGNSAANFLEGGAGNDLITGGTGADTLQGDAGADRMLGGAGNDLYFVGALSDRVFETTTQSSSVDAGGVDTVVATISFSLATSVGLSFVENLTLDGTAANATGNDLRNCLTGNDAANRLDGGLGADVLIGGAGADSFIFSTALSPGNIDRIADFVSGTDVIRLSGAIFTGLADGRLAATAFAENLSGQAADASDRIIYEIDTGRLWFDADGTGAGARVQFAALSAGLDLSNADFVIF